MIKRLTYILLAAFAVTGCGFFGGGNQGTPEGYVQYCVTMLDRQALYADTPEWAETKKAILSEDITSMDEAHDAVSRAAAVAGGKHSRLVKPVKDTVSYDEVAPEVGMLEDNVIHIVLPAHTGVRVSDSLYTHTVLDFLQEHSDAEGVILDLRGNNGGNMYPMIAALSPIIPDGIIIRFQNRKRTSPISLDYVMQNAGLSSENVKIFPSTLPIAILTDEGTGSSAEATLLCFRGLDNARSFGAPTAGYASANIVLPLADGYTLLITTGRDLARTGEVFCDDPIAPDFPTENPLPDALQWIVNHK
jgi:carboxyl-terminal processing protease